MDDETGIFIKDDGGKGPQSKIFNTSVRGWIALILSCALSIAIFLIVIAPYFNITMPDRVSDQLIALFATGFGAAVTQYFHQLNREGQKTR